MILDRKQLAAAVGILESKAAAWLPWINEYTNKYGISTPYELASFLAQCGHESMGFKRLEENLNYSAEGLANTWPNRFRDAKLKPNVLALTMARKPEKIANFVYANRMGNGDEKSGDGWKFRGRGLPMITGHNNYLKCGKAIGLDLIAKPDYLLIPEYAVKSACWFWKENGLDEVDDDISQLAETKKINGGTIGLVDRERRMKIALNAIIKGE